MARVSATPSTVDLRSKSIISKCNWPASIFEKSSISLITDSSESPEVRITSTYSFCSSVNSVSRSNLVIPITPFIGVRISWLIFARNLLLARFADCAFCANFFARIIAFLSFLLTLSVSFFASIASSIILSAIFLLSSSSLVLTLTSFSRFSFFSSNASFVNCRFCTVSLIICSNHPISSSVVISNGILFFPPAITAKWEIISFNLLRVFSSKLYLAGRGGFSSKEQKG